MIDYCKTCVHDEDRADFCDNCYYCDTLNNRGIAPTGYEEAKKQTNADRIRSKSDEELAEYLSYLEFPWRPAYAKKDEKEWLDWLKKERER